MGSMLYLCNHLPICFSQCGVNCLLWKQATGCRPSTQHFRWPTFTRHRHKKRSLVFLLRIGGGTKKFTQSACHVSDQTPVNKNVGLLILLDTLFLKVHWNMIWECLIWECPKWKCRIWECLICRNQMEDAPSLCCLANPILLYKDHFIVIIGNTVSVGRINKYNIHCLWTLYFKN